MKDNATPRACRPRRGQYWLAVAGIAAAFALVPHARHAESLLDTTVRIEGSEAQSVTRELAEQF